MIRSFTYSAEEPGPRVLILGAVHGNEVCGTHAIKRIMGDLEGGKLRLLRGHVEFVPIANPRAHEAGQRFVERNLNRFFLPTDKPKTYEAKLTNVLGRMIEVCDYFIDLHSTTAGSIPFANVEGIDPEEHTLCKAMGAEAILYGWHQAYAASGRTISDPDESMGTTAYARMHGAKAITLECGQHQAMSSVEVAYKAIQNVLRYLGVADGEFSMPTNEMLTVRTTRVVYRGDGGSFVESWSNFAPITMGQKIAVLPDGSFLLAPADGYIVMPNPHTPPNTEWFYFGEKI